jgi:hypothetical protein
MFNVGLVLLWFGLNFLISGGGAYFGAYLKQKGKNLATHEDIDKLLKEVRATTQATKEIEAKISNEMWNRQKHWELRREVLFEALRRITGAFDQLGQLEIVLQTQLKHPHMPQDVFELRRIEENNKWFKASAALRESRLFIEVTCGKEVVDASDKFIHLATTVAAKIHSKDAAIFKQSSNELLALNDAIRNAIRKELVIDQSAKS